MGTDESLSIHMKRFKYNQPVFLILSLQCRRHYSYRTQIITPVLCQDNELPHDVRLLGQDGGDDLAVYVGETKSSSLVFECQSFVVDTQEVEQCRLEVVHVYGVTANVIAKFIRLTV